VKNKLTLVGLDIEGDWNIPLLANAAEMSGASLLFATSAGSSSSIAERVAAQELNELTTQFDCVIACEATKRAKPVYEFAAPRGHLGIVVGNERLGIPANVLKDAEHVVSIPMLGRGLSSINVAAAAAIVLYAVERDLGRRRPKTSGLCHNDVDVLVFGPPDPSELGSLLRSAWAFGWQRVFLADRDAIWFSKDRPTVLAGRAAARCEVNRIAVSPDTQLNMQDYDHIVVCDNTPTGTPLSRYTLPDRGKMLLVYAGTNPQIEDCDTVERIYVDHSAAVEPRFRHAGSILLSAISRLLRRGRRG
jgi:tRNA G18 (ribose-2'-O)-methylase SpoU